VAFEASKAKAKALDTHILYAGERLEFSFLPSKLSPEWFDKQEDYGSENDFQGLAKIMSEVMVDWDMADDGEPVELSEENLAYYIEELGLPFAGVINRKMQEMSVDEKGEIAKRRRRGG
jgi:hypothetical protein